MEARAVIRLLLRKDTMAPVLFMEPVHYNKEPCADLEEQVRCLANALLFCVLAVQCTCCLATVYSST